MTKFKLNVIKLSVIAAILTLICISCTVNLLDPKSPTDVKENAENLENEAGNPGSLEQKSQEETTASKLEAIAKTLEAQKEKENTEIEKIKQESDLLETLDSKIQPVYFTEPGTTEETKKNVKMQIKRIIYSSLDYEKDKINKLKEIIETLKDSPDREYIARGLLYHTALGIQEQIEKNLKSIKGGFTTLSEKELEELLIHAEFDLKLKEKFKKTLEKTVDEVSKTIKDIKDYYSAEKSKEYSLSDSEIKKIEDSVTKEYIVGHITENYQIFDSATYSAEKKQTVNLDN
ncbi:complement regulator-acquiring protein (plasmid) [Borreliella finlandensis]|uniref:complement regulator-acquiring protein n=1 Tax=Borreliella finlandensis TaxID=498741 RepID=UPI002649D852|nr:complement regulator-acquiring protein [Borreliella finlandensis]WKC89545.1 complement regulator-acquiring protein [Borreliella finlandensis]